MHRAQLNNFTCAVLLIGALTLIFNRESIAGSREPALLSHVIGGKDDQMTTLINPGHGMGRLVHNFEAGDCFSARISGTSMRPDYRDGDRVILNVVDVKNAASMIGRDCMFWRSDGKATFKCLRSIRGDTLILHPLNREDFPKPLSVRMSDLRVLAFASYIHREVPYQQRRHERSGAPDISKAAHLGGKSSKRKAIATAA